MNSAMRIGFFGEDDLARREVRVAGRRIALVAPRAPEALIDAVDPDDFAKDERLPYWAELWPSAIVLAEHAFARAAALAGRDALELGCGLGLAGIAAVLAGARSVVFTDWYEEALLFAAENARQNGVERFETRALDWRAPDLGGRRFPVALGSDLLYERRNREPLAAALAPGGFAWIADPGRSTAEGFAEIAAARGLVAAPGPVYVVPPATVRITEVQKPAPRAGARCGRPG